LGGGFYMCVQQTRFKSWFALIVVNDRFFDKKIIGAKGVLAAMWFWFLLAQPAMSCTAEAYQYQAKWNGLLIGRLAYQSHCQGGSLLCLEALIESESYIHTLGMRYENKVSLIFDASGPVKQFLMDTKWKKRQRTSEIVYDYKQAPYAILSSSHSQPMPGAKYVIATAEQTRFSHDPLRVLWELRPELERWLHTPPQLKTQISRLLFDGRSLFYLDVTYLGHQSVKLSGAMREMIAIYFSRRVVAGFSHNELRRLSSAGQKDDISMTVYFLPTQIHAPSYAEIHTPFGDVFVTPFIDKDGSKPLTINHFPCQISGFAP
jgi:hypothetical protein